MDRKTFAIGILSVTALVLFLCTMIPVSHAADGGFAVKDLQGWQMMTASSQQGGDVLYVIDPDGKIVVLAYNPVQKVMQPVGSGDLASVLVSK